MENSLPSKYENGVTPLGLDLTGFVQFGEADNIIAVKVDNSNNYKEEATGADFEWMGRAFNPNYGGLNQRHLAAPHRQGLPDAAALRKSPDDGCLHLRFEFRHQK